MSSMEPEYQPTLAEMEIPEVQPGIVEDTFENRQKLRSVGYRWTQYYHDESDGSEELEDGAQLLKTIGTAESRRMSLDRLERKAEILVDPEDAWSDFVDPLELLKDAPVPYWVRIRVANWERLERQGFDPAKSGIWLPRRCSIIKNDGTRCWMWAGSSKMQYEMGMCKPHLNQNTSIRSDTYVKSARQKLYENAPAAADMLENLSQTAEQESVRLKASLSSICMPALRLRTLITSSWLTL